MVHRLGRRKYESEVGQHNIGAMGRNNFVIENKRCYGEINIKEILTKKK